MDVSKEYLDMCEDAGIKLNMEPKPTKLTIYGKATFDEMTRISEEMGIRKLPYKVRGISWGGNFFLGLVKEGLQELMDYDTYDNKTDDLEDMDVLYVVSPRISRQRLFRKALDNGIHIVWHWIGSDVLSLQDECKLCNGLPDIYRYKADQQTHLGVSANLVDELQDMGLKATEMNLVSNWDFGVRPLPDEFTVLVYYPPIECTAYAQDAVQRIVKKCKDIKFILYGMRGGQKLDFKKPKNVTLDYWRDTEDDMAKLYESGSCLLRYNNHDGYPSSIIEAVMMGRQVITNGRFPYTIHVDTEAEVLESLNDIKDSRVLNVRGSKYYREHQTREVYLRGFLGLLKEVMG